MSSIILRHKNYEKAIEFEDNNTILEVFQNNGISISAPCGGNGKCGKCRITVLIDGKEHKLLACDTMAEDGLIVIQNEEDKMDICDDFVLTKNNYHHKENGYAIAVDLGTTTVAAQLVELSTGKSLDIISEMNNQKPFGADVITRTQYIMDHDNGLEVLSEVINNQIRGMVEKLCLRNNIKDTVKIFVAGNTIMQHIMANLSPESIASVPYTPITLFDLENSIIGDVRYSPCISGYVGGDITAGILSTGMHKENKNCLLLDLGTNGEMALCHDNEIVCCSVASGPAFEGAGISCGMASISGAINHFNYEDNRLSYSTIGNAEAIGICGSGIIELIAILVKLGIVDGSGYLQPPEELDDTFGLMLEEDKDGNGIVYITTDKSVFFTAKDVRQLQLAKSAVASGIQILLEETQLYNEDVDCLYLAGGFGTYIDVKSAAYIGMISDTISKKAVSVGNSALAGVSLAVASDMASDELYSIAEKCRYIELSGDRRFNDYFTDNMAFYEE